MKILKDLKAKRAAEQDEVRKLIVSIEKRTDSSPTDEEDAKLVELRASIVKLDKQIEFYEAQKDELTKAAEAPDTEDRSAATSGTRAPIQVEVVQSAQPVFRSFADQLAAMTYACVDVPLPNVPHEVRTAARKKLEEVEKRHLKAADAETRQYILENRAPQGLNTGAGPDGGYLIQDDFAAGIMKMSLDQSAIAPDCKTQELSANSQGLKMTVLDESSRATGSRYGGVRAYWGNEAGTVAASRPKVKKWQVALDKLTSLGWATEEELEDVPVMASMMTESFGSEGGWVLDEALFFGAGGGSPLGIMNSKALIVVNKESGQAAATVNTLNLLKMLAVLLTQNGTAKGTWYMNQEIKPLLPQLTLATGSASGSLVYLPQGSILGSQKNDTLLGLPIKYTEHNPALGTQGDIILADMSMFQIITKGGPRLDSSIHVSFVNGEVVFRLVQRIGGKPIIETPITPAKGTSGVKYSPFVTLQAR